MSSLGRAYDKWTDKIKVDTGFSWWTPWWAGWMFTIGYVDPQWDGLWFFIKFILLWPIYLGEALR